MAWGTIVQGYVKFKEGDEERVLDMLRKLNLSVNCVYKEPNGDRKWVYISVWDDANKITKERVEKAIQEYKDVLLEYEFAIWLLDKPDYYVRG